MQNGGYWTRNAQLVIKYNGWSGKAGNSGVIEGAAKGDRVEHIRRRGRTDEAADGSFQVTVKETLKGSPRRIRRRLHKRLPLTRLHIEKKWRENGRKEKKGK